MGVVLLQPEGSPVYRMLINNEYVIKSCIDISICIMVYKKLDSLCSRLAVPVDWPMKVLPVKHGKLTVRNVTGKAFIRDPSTLNIIASINSKENNIAINLAGVNVDSHGYSWVLLDFDSKSRENIASIALILVKLKPKIVYAVRLYTMGSIWAARTIKRLSAPLIDPLGLYGGIKDVEIACRASIAS